MRAHRNAIEGAVFALCTTAIVLAVIHVTFDAFVNSLFHPKKYLRGKLIDTRSHQARARPDASHLRQGLGYAIRKQLYLWQ